MTMQIRRVTFRALITLLSLTILFVVSVAAQQSVTTRYVYDANGRLRAVITPEGAAVYEYDPAGNFTAIRNLGRNGCEALEITPRQGPPSTLVTIYGVGFNEQVSRVMFNGVAAQIVPPQTPISVTVRVPDTATTGPIAVNLPCGVKTFPTPFIVSGVMVLPMTIAMLPNRTAQFIAKVAGIADPAVRWTVNDIEGGNQSLGIITQSGFYTAPPTAANSLIAIRATSALEPMLFGEAMVTVTDRGAELFATAVSVQYGTPPRTIQAYANAPVSVRYGVPPNVVPSYVAEPISVRYSGTPNTAPAYMSEQVSIRHGTSSSASAPPMIADVVVRGQTNTAASPRTVTKGDIVMITIKGSNLTAITGLTFINEDGTADEQIVPSEIKVSDNGTTITARIAIKPEAKTGLRIIRVMTATGNWPIGADNVSTIEVIP